ncbi:MAG: hypothetical protein ACKPGK_02910 [Verrucomicrobiota bacterium]
MTDLAGLLLWLSWRGFGSRPMSSRPALTLASNLRPAGGGAGRGGPLAIPVLAMLLLTRASLHHGFSPHFAEAIPWSLGAVTVVFRSDLWLRILAHSVLSWVGLLLKAYLCFAFLATLCRRDADADPITQSIRGELGRLGRWPWGLPILVVLVAFGGLWLLVSPALVSAGLAPARVSTLHVIQQAAVVSVAGLAFLKWPLTLLCLMRFVLDHVYLGTMPLWDHLHGTGGRLSGWLAPVPLKWGRIDLAPLVAAGFFWSLGHFLQGAAPRLFQRLPL